MKQELSILFWLKRSVAKSSKDESAPIYIRITIDGRSKEISLGEKISTDQWNNEVKAVRGNHPDAKRINKKIFQAKVDLDRHFMVLQAQYKFVTPEMLKNIYEGRPAVVEEQSITILEAFDMFLERFEKMVQKKFRSYETFKKWKCNKRKVKQFIKIHFRKEDIQLKSIKTNFAGIFLDHLMLTEGLSQNTAMKYVEDTWQILTMAKEKGWIKTNPMQAFKCK